MLAVMAIAISSCSKESKINKKLDGSWKATVVEGTAVASGESYVYTFTKDSKDNGTGTISITSVLGTYAGTFTYTLAEDKITTTTTMFGSSSTDVSTVVTYEKDKLEFKNSDNELTTFVPN